MASPPILRISPETRSGPTILIFLIAPILLLIVLISILNGSPVFSFCICGVLLLLLNAVKEYKFSEFAFSVRSVMIRPLQSLIAGMFSLFPLRLFTYL